MELVLMCLLLLVKLEQLLPQLVQQLVRLEQLVRVVQQLVSRRVVHDRGVELHSSSPLVVDELVHDL